SNPRPRVAESLSFSVQQMNLFMFKQIDEKFSGFINLEIINSLSTEDQWGGFALDEAWVKYDRGQHLKVKAGLLVPTFNNLNTIRDRTPLLPYIMRPFAYETLVSDFLSTDELAPRQAAIEVYGTLGMANQIKFDYAAYVGNNTAYMIQEAIATLPSGSDSTLAKLFGGRIGIRKGPLKLGISVSHDYADLSRIPIFTTDFSGVGTLPRSRLGFDLSLTFPGFYVESEFIRVYYSLSAEKRARLEEIVETNFLFNEDLNKLFGYVTVGADIGESFFAYGMFSFVEDRSNIVTEDGFGMYSIGGGYRANDFLVFKVQLVYTSTFTQDLFYGKETDVLVGLSVFL
ncbi:MAG: hypothetical protein AAF564_21375, partial [Bacteroidota bacterium]